ncbi:hypothetical protein [Nostoc sp. CHAB 5836]|nr:hypothetical protein [Nostoc sp. CHAB 5836]
MKNLRTNALHCDRNLAFCKLWLGKSVDNEKNTAKSDRPSH